MAEQLVGAASVLVVVLGYVLLVQVLMAAIILLGMFTVLQWRSLVDLLGEPPRPVPATAEADQGEPPSGVRVGGGVIFWD